MLAAFLAIGFQYKIAPVDAEQFVRQSIGCLLVTPDKKGSMSRVNKVLWGTRINPGDRLRLKAYVFWDYDPHQGKDGDIGPLGLDGRSIVFTQTPPIGVRLAQNERFADWPMISFGGSRRDCYHDVSHSLVVGGLLFSRAMKRSHRNSVSLNEVIQELTRIRASQQYPLVGYRRKD